MRNLILILFGVLLSTTLFAQTVHKPIENPLRSIAINYQLNNPNKVESGILFINAIVPTKVQPIWINSAPEHPVIFTASPAQSTVIINNNSNPIFTPEPVPARSITNFNQEPEHITRFRNNLNEINNRYKGGN
jgi:hypothetical protein